MRSFYQDRLGTNIGKTQKRRPFSQVATNALGAGVEKTLSLSLIVTILFCPTTTRQ